MAITKRSDMKTVRTELAELSDELVSLLSCAWASKHVDSKNKPKEPLKIRPRQSFDDTFFTPSVLKNSIT